MTIFKRKAFNITRTDDVKVRRNTSTFISRRKTFEAYEIQAVQGILNAISLYIKSQIGINLNLSFPNKVLMAALRRIRCTLSDRKGKPHSY